jgi:hypothetical protein
MSMISTFRAINRDVENSSSARCDALGARVAAAPTAACFCCSSRLARSGPNKVLRYGRATRPVSSRSRSPRRCVPASVRQDLDVCASADLDLCLSADLDRCLSADLDRHLDRSPGRPHAPGPPQASSRAGASPEAG